MRRRHGISAASIVSLLLFLAGCAASPSPAPTASSVTPAATSQSSQATSAPAPATGAPQPTAAPAGQAATPQAGALNPNCALQPIDLGKYGGADFKNPNVVTSQNGVLRTTLDVRYGQNTIAGCPVKLRSYNGQLVGDTWRVKPGDTLEITLTNSLPPSTDQSSLAIYNVTNLHTHGLHTSPSGSEQEGWGDNVLLRIWPKGSQPAAHEHGDIMVDVIGEARYKIQIPKDHPAGTFWYHAHAHGSTAAQVSSGMGGALIIEGGPKTLDSVPEIKAAAEQVFVLQQNVYSSTGEIEEPDYGDFGPCTWEPTFREHTINGQLFPTITMAPGEVQRWRFVHAGVRETVSLELRGPGADGVTTVTPTLAMAWNPLYEIAVDGIALGRIGAWQRVELNPGYRSDDLVQAPATPGTYYLIDGPSSTQALTCPSNTEQPSLLAKVVVKGEPKQMSLPTSEAIAKVQLPFPDIVRMDLTQTPGSEAFLLPIPQISTFQETEFTVAAHPITATKSISYTKVPVVFLAGDRPFSSDHVRTVTLGNYDLWILQTKSDSLYYAHPFHIHINPFQTWRPGPTGQPELVWRDTLLVPKGQPQYIYTYYKPDTEASSGFPNFTTVGTFVYHCHILDHEDQGMMEAVRIASP